MVVFQVAAGVLLGKVLYDLLNEALSKTLPKKPVEKKAAPSKKEADGQEAYGQKKGQGGIRFYGFL